MQGFELEVYKEKQFYIQTNLWDKGFVAADLGESIFPALKHDKYAVWEDADTGEVNIAPVGKD